MNETNYLKTDDDYTATQRAELPEIDHHRTFAALPFPVSTEYAPVFRPRAHAPPKSCTSRELLLHNSVLLI